MKSKIFIPILVASLVLTGCGIRKKAVTEESAPEIKEEVSTSDEPESDEIVIPDDIKDVYRLFLRMDETPVIKAKVDDEVTLGYIDWEYQHTGEELSFKELYEIMKDSRSLEGDFDPEVYYTFLDIDDNTLLAVKFQGMNIYSSNDDSYSVLIFNYADGELHITHSYDEWARNKVILSSEGYIESEGSAGAGKTIYEAGVLLSDGTYKGIYVDDRVMHDWLRDSIDPDVYDEIYGDRESAPDVAVHSFDFDGEILCIYEDISAGTRDSADQRFIDELEKAGVKLVDNETINQKIKEAGEALVGERFSYIYNCPAIWNKVYDDENKDILIKSFGETSGWNYKESVTSLRVKDEETQKLIDGYTLVETVGTPGDDDYFRLYLTDDDKSVIVTPDDSLVAFDFSLCDFIYENVPELKAADFDGDGEYELAIKPFLFHGTGFSQESLILLEGYGGGYWFSSHLTPQKFIQDIGEHLRFINNEQTIDTICDGQKIIGDTIEFSDSGNLYLDDIVEIEFGDIDFTVRACPVYYDDDNPMGIMLGTAKATYSYNGYEWKMDDFAYYKNESPAKLLEDFANGSIKDSEGYYVIYCDEEYADEDLGADIALVDLDEDNEDELVVRLYGGYIPFIYDARYGEVRCVDTQCMGSSSPSFINSKNQMVHTDVTHANRQQYSVVSFYGDRKSYPVISFSDWYEYEDVPSSHEYTMEDGFLWDEEVESEIITKDKFEELVDEYTEVNSSIKWEKRSQKQ